MFNGTSAVHFRYYRDRTTTSKNDVAPTAFLTIASYWRQGETRERQHSNRQRQRNPHNPAGLLLRFASLPREDHPTGRDRVGKAPGMPQDASGRKDGRI